MAQSNGDEELRLIKELDDLFPDEELIVTEWDTHWPRIIDFILADRKQHELEAKRSGYIQGYEEGINGDPYSPPAEREMLGK